MQFDLRNFEGHYYPTTEMFTVLKFTPDEIEQFTKITYSLYKYGKMGIGLVPDFRINEIRETVKDFILARRDSTFESEITSHELFSMMFDLLLNGATETIETKEVSESLVLAELYYEVIRNDHWIKQEREELCKADKSIDVREKAHSLVLLLTDVLDEIADADKQESCSFFYENASKLGLLSENLTELKNNLVVEGDLALTKEELQSHESKKINLIQQIETIEQKQKVA